MKFKLLSSLLVTTTFGFSPVVFGAADADLQTPSETEAYLELPCYALMSGIADEFEVPVDPSTGLVNGAPGSKYDNTVSPAQFDLEATCEVTVTAEKAAGEFTHESDPSMIISDARGHSDAEIQLDGESDSLDSGKGLKNYGTVDGYVASGSVVNLTVQAQLGADITSTTPDTILKKGRYNMPITLTVADANP